MRSAFLKRVAFILGVSHSRCPPACGLRCSFIRRSCRAANATILGTIRRQGPARTFCYAPRSSRLARSSAFRRFFLVRYRHRRASGRTRCRYCHRDDALRWPANRHSSCRHPARLQGSSSRSAGQRSRPRCRHWPHRRQGHFAALSHWREARSRLTHLGPPLRRHQPTRQRHRRRHVRRSYQNLSRRCQLCPVHRQSSRLDSAASTIISSPKSRAVSPIKPAIPATWSTS